MSVKLLSSRLKQTFGYDDFRPLQREIMEASLAGRDAVASGVTIFARNTAA